MSHVRHATLTCRPTPKVRYPMQVRQARSSPPITICLRLTHTMNACPPPWSCILVVNIWRPTHLSTATKT
ncbi:hypothetical protein [Moraxella lacunata]|uniref:hypothetical protein n=1 Tax=Moraxella lacunata TaxID=477 RepID=UPI003EE21B5B